MTDLNVKKVLRLNGNLMRIGWATPQDAFTAMMGEGEDGSPPALGLDVIYNLNENGEFDTQNLIHFDKYEWDLWMLLDPRVDRNGKSLDEVIHTSHATIRIPSIIVCNKFRTMPMKTIRPTKRAIRELHGNTCAYSGVKLTNKTASIDHVLPKSRGGKDTWLNQVPCHKDINSRKGNKLNEEAGLKLLYRPFEPKPMPLCSLITDNKHIDHTHF